MIKLLIRNGFRSLVKQMPYSFVNVLGMTIGVASVLVLIIWISAETSYDKFHKDQERMYRVALIIKTPNIEYNQGSINMPAGPEYKREFPVIEEMVRVDPKTTSIGYNNKFSQLSVLYTDKTFFDMFSFDLIKGDKKTCLDSPQSIVLTQKAVKKIFGSEDPLGKLILIAGNTFNVTAVAKDPPFNTIFQFECLLPISIEEKQYHIGWDGGLTAYTFLRLIKGTDPSQLEKQIMVYMEGAINKTFRQAGFLLTPYLQKISEIHLFSTTDRGNDIGEKGSITKLYMFSGIGLLILLIACFNFVNISTAISFRRAKEVSVKKIFGSERKNIILFFFVESAIAISVSLLLAFLLVKILLPVIAGMIGKDLALTIIKLRGWILIFTSLFLFCTGFASFYSSFYLSSINPLALLSDINQGKRKQSSRNIMVTFQFAISTGLIISCLVIYSQMQFVRKLDKGFDEKNLLVVNLSSKTSASYGLIEEKLSSVPGVMSVTVSAGGKPGVGFTSNGYQLEGVEKPVMLNALYVDENYLKTLKISLIDGRDFRNIKVDSNKVIVNQTFVKMFGRDNPIGKFISRGAKYEVIGEVKDFNTSALYNKTQPIFISTVNEFRDFEDLIVKYQPLHISDVLKSTETIIREIDPSRPFMYEFLEDSINSSYAIDLKLNILFLVLSVIAIFISSLGLFGLATFSTQSRMKEISIRKINGATISDIFRKFNFELLKWVLISFVIAFPVGYYAMSRWLNNFAYKTTISLWLLISSGLFTLAIGLLTVSWAANKASRTNPSETLRKE
ncbi:MAG: ABC transporter permease [Bacteroidales bacterium]